jgi:hypothetical protein
MLKTTPSNLMAEIASAVDYRDRHMEGHEEKVARYTGPFYDRHDDFSQEYAPENTYYEYISLMVPRLVFDNPRVQVTTRRPGTQKDVAEALRHGMNRWSRDSQLRKMLIEVASDYLLGFGIVCIRPDYRASQARPNDTTYRPHETDKWPACERIAPRRFFVDPEAERFHEARFMGHMWRADKDDLLDMATKSKDAGWDIEAIEALSVQEDPNAKHGYTWEGTPSRNEVFCYEIYVPEARLDDSPSQKAGFHGVIYTLGVNQPLGYNDEDAKSQFIRKPRAFYGPATGPYVQFGAYKVPDKVYPLAPLTAVEGQVRELNDQVHAASASMMKHKRIVGVNDPRTAQLVKNVQHDYVAVVPFEDGKALVQEFQFGGVSDQQANWIATCRQRADRVLGMDEALRGSVSGTGTATEHSIASEAANTRIAYLKQSFVDSTVQVLTKVAFYMYHDDEIKFPLGIDAMKELGVPDNVEVLFQGGGHESGDYTFEDLELEIEPYSMERASEGLAQKRALEMHSMLLNSLQLMQAFPDYPWRDHFAKIGNAMNTPDMLELIPDALLQRLSEDLAMQRQGMAVQVQQQSMQPRMSKDAGAGGVTTGKAPSKRVPMAMQEIASVMQQMQQPAPTGAPAQGVQGPNSAM